MPNRRTLRQSETLRLLGRIALASGGGFAAVRGMRRRDPLGIAVALAGVALAIDAVRPESASARMFPTSTTPERIVRGITIARPRRQVYDFWRDLTNHPLFVPGLARVEALGGGQTRWIFSDAGGATWLWDAVVTHEQPLVRLDWQATGDLPHRGSVLFRDARSADRTHVRLTLELDPPTSPAAERYADFHGDRLAQAARVALHRFKQILESQPPVPGGTVTGYRV